MLKFSVDLRLATTYKLSPEFIAEAHDHFDAIDRTKCGWLPRVTCLCMSAVGLKMSVRSLDQERLADLDGDAAVSMAPEGNNWHRGCSSSTAVPQFRCHRVEVSGSYLPKSATKPPLSEWPSFGTGWTSSLTALWILNAKEETMDMLYIFANSLQLKHLQKIETQFLRLTFYWVPFVPSKSPRDDAVTIDFEEFVILLHVLYQTAEGFNMGFGELLFPGIIKREIPEGEEPDTSNALEDRPWARWASGSIWVQSSLFALKTIL